MGARQATRRTRKPARQITNPATTSRPDGFGPCERVGNSPSNRRAKPASMASRPNKAAIIRESDRIRTMSNESAQAQPASDIRHANRGV